MGRVIKFRAWDKSFKKIFNCDFVNKEGIGVAEDLTTGITLASSLVMQFTGLLDKNGKEIYEGDILQDFDTPMWTYSIYWNGHYGSWGMKTKDGFCVAMFRHTELKSYKYEIIGNLYETPNLVRGE